MLRQALIQRLNEIMDGPPSLDKALLIAVLAHAGQKDKGGSSYIRHPLRVMEAQETEDEMMPAVLHDVAEDTEISLLDLVKAGFTTHQIDIVDALTKREGEDYKARIARVASNPVAARIKIADVLDNSAIWRLKKRYDLKESDLVRFGNYVDALNTLGYRR